MTVSSFYIVKIRKRGEIMLDFLAVIIICIYAFKGWRRGLILSILSIVGYIISLVVARAFSSDLTKFLIDNTGIDHWVDSFLGDRMRDMMQMDIPTQMVTGFATEAIVNAISFFIIFSITSMIVFNIANFLNRIGKLPVIGTLNRFGGLIFGIAKAFILIMIVLAVLSFVVNNGNAKLGESIKDTIIVDTMYHNNPILNFINGIFESKGIKSKGYI